MKCDFGLANENSTSEWGTSHEKHIKMAVLDNQAKIQQVQPKYRGLSGKSHLGFSEASVYKISSFGSRGVRKYWKKRKVFIGF